MGNASSRQESLLTWRLGFVSGWRYFGFTVRATGCIILWICGEFSQLKD